MIFFPDAFRGDWYGWATNQLSHAFLGSLLSTVAALAWWFIAGEYPVRVVALAVMVAGYVCFEVIQARRAVRFNIGDSAEDALFFGYGAALVFLPFHEVQRTLLTLEPQPGLFFAVLGFVVFHSAIGIGRRVWQARGQRDGR